MNTALAAGLFHSLSVAQTRQEYFSPALSFIWGDHFVSLSPEEIGVLVSLTPAAFSISKM
jgi:hypothetical protein